MKKFIISIEAVDGKQHEFEIKYKKTVTVACIENSIQAREARFFRFGQFILFGGKGEEGLNTKKASITGAFFLCYIEITH